MVTATDTERRIARLELWCVVLAAMNGAQIVGHVVTRFGA
jgi:hypothetical protein